MDKNEEVVMGAVAKNAHDMTVAAIMGVDTHTVYDVASANGLNWQVQFQFLVAVHKRWSPLIILLDGSKSIRDMLQVSRYPVRAFTTTSADRFFLAENLKTALQKNEIKLPPNEALVAELEQFVQGQGAVEQYSAAIALALHATHFSKPRIASYA